MTYPAHPGMFSALALFCSLAEGGAVLSVHSIPTAETRSPDGLPPLPAALSARTAGEGVPTKAPALPGGARLTPEQAAALAVNRLSETAEGLELRHPRYRAQFTAAGVWVEPRQGALRWQWRLQGVTRAATPLEGVNLGAVRPHALRRPEGTLVRYPRGVLTEQYVPREGSLEQQFVLAESLPLQGADLVVRGRIDSPGRFERSERGWRWRTDRGEVTLGEVTVFDATGARLPATLAVSATETRLTVDGPALARAVYPVTLDPEIGANDFRISDMGPDGNVNFEAFSPAMAYNSLANEYLGGMGGGR
ncbi:MAG: hypothetical protein ACREXW_20310 [Gammaproteobacteria bacterium]